MMPRLTQLICGSIVTGAALCGVLALRPRASATRTIEAALPDFGVLPEFSLIDQQGQTVSRQGLAGSVWVADFIFTRCSGQCPMMSAQMAALQQAFGQPSGIRLISFTVDPAYDTREVLAAYAAHYGARPGRWQFVTGTPEAITALAEKGFRLSVAESGSAQEPITHSVRLVLIDQQGHIRGYYDATEAAVVDRLRTDAQRLARSGS